MLRSKVLDSLLLFILRAFLVQLIVAVSSFPSEFLLFVWFICSLWNDYFLLREETCFNDAGILFGLSVFFVLFGVCGFFFVSVVCRFGKVSADFLTFCITSCMQLLMAFFFPLAWTNPWFPSGMCSSGLFVRPWSGKTIQVWWWKKETEFILLEELYSSVGKVALFNVLFCSFLQIWYLFLGPKYFFSCSI